MQIFGRDFTDEKRRSMIAGCFYVNLLLVVAFLSDRFQETGASQQTLTNHRHQRSGLLFKPYDHLTEDEKRSVVTIEYNIQHINSTSWSNVLVSIYNKTREVIVSQLNKKALNAAITTTTDYDKTSASAATTTTTTTKTNPVFTIIVTLPPPPPSSNRRRRRRRREREREEVTYKENDLHFVEYYPEIVALDLRISIFIRRQDDASHRIQKLHQVVNSSEFKRVLQTEVRAQVVRIYRGIPANVSTRSSSVRPSSNFRSLCISLFLLFNIVHTLCSADTMDTR